MNRLCHVQTLTSWLKSINHSQLAYQIITEAVKKGKTKAFSVVFLVDFNVEILRATFT